MMPYRGCTGLYDSASGIMDLAQNTQPKSHMPAFPSGLLKELIQGMAFSGRFSHGQKQTCPPMTRPVPCHLRYIVEHFDRRAGNLAHSRRLDFLAWFQNTNCHFLKGGVSRSSAASCGFWADADRLQLVASRLFLEMIRLLVFGLNVSGRGWLKQRARALDYG
jgi:hypothetical protein